ncbi:MAG: S1 RNA-binding domain-containing protein [Chloroflexi bacterium]|nr:S1 RNA-binding domain-containing protein [Chloroflexota bacterium]MCL5275795.1 S1 RNA-binding domain-containing protein [Chloroflexota bacterium]
MSNEVTTAPQEEGGIQENAAAAPVTALEDLRPRMAFKGKVSRIDLGGAFVNIGLEVEGFIHISRIVSAVQNPVTRVAEVLSIGDDVDVYIAAVNPTMKRIDLTMARPATYDWADLRVGMKIRSARVVALESFGAFVDIDGPKHGLVPFNLMPKGQRPKVGDDLEAVWVIEVSEDKRRIGLTMIEPPALPWESIHRGDVVKGVVTRVERKGAFIDIGAEREGLIRSSAFGSGFVNVSDFVTVGEQVSARVVKVDAPKKQIDLAMEGIDPDDFTLSSGPEEELSPMAAALQKATRGRRSGWSETSGRGGKKGREQDDILARTMQQLQRNK